LLAWLVLELKKSAEMSGVIVYLGKGGFTYDRRREE
jgi:hypothetical protein